MSAPAEVSSSDSSHNARSKWHMGKGRKKDGPQIETMSRRQIHIATHTRKVWSLIASFFLLVGLVFLILVEIGNIADKPVIRDTWFISLNLSNVIPSSVGSNSALLNSIAQSLGLHDFYQVGLWNYCEGYNSQGITDCSPTTARYWFNPVRIIVSELLSGSSINLPQELTSILGIVRVASHWMFALFMTGSVLSFVLIFVSPISLYSRWLAFLVVGIFSFINALFVTVACIIATVMFCIMDNVFKNNKDQVNIIPTIGTQMFAFMWIASGCTLIAFIIQLCLMCCCASRRDIKKGKKWGNKKAYALEEQEKI